MRAVTISSFGGVEGLEVSDLPEPPAPTANRVRVRIHTSALNRADLLQRRGRYPAPPGASQDIPGLEFAGEIEQTGEEVQRWRVGQRVFGITGGGAQAELIVVPETWITEIPDNLDWIQAAAVPEVFITAHDALFTQAWLQLGESVLVHAAGSGVGTAAIQLAREAGAVAYGTSRTREKLRRAAELGLKDFVAVEADPARFEEAVRDWTAGKGVNVILDLVGAPYFRSNLNALSLKGRLMLVGTVGGGSAEFDFATAMRKRLKITGTVLRARSEEEKADAVARFAAHVVPLLAGGDVVPIIDTVFPVDEVRKAHEYLESNESFGKVVLTFNKWAALGGRPVARVTLRNVI